MGIEINRQSILTTDQDGGSLVIVASKTGEVLARCAVAPGRHRAHYWIDLLQDDEHLEVEDNVVCFQPRNRMKPDDFGDMQHETGANPNFKRDDAERSRLEMEARLRKLEAEVSRSRRRERVAQGGRPDPKPPVPEEDDDNEGQPE